MTGGQLQTLFHSIIDDTISDTLFLDLLNTIYNTVNGMREWEMLKKLDQSQSSSSGDSYTTAKTLPSDFLLPLEIFIGTNNRPHRPIPFEQRERFKNSAFRYYIDYRNSQFFIIGVGGGTINFFYIYSPTELTLSSSPVWPSLYHRTLAYLVAELHQGAIDVDDIANIKQVGNRTTGLRMLNAMINWDAQMKANAQDFSSDFVEPDLLLEPAKISDEA